MIQWNKTRKCIEGYLDMGTPQIPPLPTKIGLTDRVTGDVYYLTTDGVYPALTIVVSTMVVTDNVAGVRVYDAYFGPVVNTNMRLFVSSGTLSVEPLTERFVSGQGQTRVFARNANTSQAVEVTAPGGVLTYTNIQL